MHLLKILKNYIVAAILETYYFLACVKDGVLSISVIIKYYKTLVILQLPEPLFKIVYFKGRYNVVKADLGVTFLAVGALLVVTSWIYSSIKTGNVTANTGSSNVIDLTQIKQVAQKPGVKFQTVTIGVDGPINSNTGRWLVASGNHNAPFIYNMWNQTVWSQSVVIPNIEGYKAYAIQPGIRLSDGLLM